MHFWHTFLDAGSGEERSLSANASRFYQMLSAAMATGEYEKVVQGVFEKEVQ